MKAGTALRCYYQKILYLLVILLVTLSVASRLRHSGVATTAERVSYILRCCSRDRDFSPVVFLRMTMKGSLLADELYQAAFHVSIKRIPAQTQ